MLTTPTPLRSWGLKNAHNCTFPQSHFFHCCYKTIGMMLLLFCFSSSLQSQTVPCSAQLSTAPTPCINPPGSDFRLELDITMIPQGSNQFCMGDGQDPPQTTDGCGTFVFTNLTPGTADCPAQLCFSPRQGCGNALGNTCMWVDDGMGGCMSLGTIDGADPDGIICIDIPPGVTEYEITVCRPGNGPVSVNDVSFVAPAEINIPNQEICNLDLPATVDLTALEPVGQMGGTWTSTDLNVSDPTMVTINGAVGQMFTATYSVTTVLESGSTCTVSGDVIFTITDDCCPCTQEPTINCPATPAPLGCNPPNIDPVTGIPGEIAATDPASNGVTATAEPDCMFDLLLTNEVGPTTVDNCTYTLTRTYQAFTDCGDFASAPCDVTYTWTQDTEMPVLNCPAGSPIDLGCNPPSTQGVPNEIVTSVIGSDNCDGAISTSDFNDSNVTLTGCDQGLTRTFTYTDACDNTGTCDVSYIWTVDTEDPVLSCPTGSPIDLGCNPPGTPGIPDAVVSSVAVSDNCDGIDTAVDFNDDNLDLNGCDQSITRTFTYTDNCDNTGTCTVTYEWMIDNELPVLECPGDGTPMDLGCNPPLDTDGIPTAIPGNIPVTDNCDGTTTTSDFTDSNIDLDGCEQGLTRTFTYTDACGNTNTCAAIYTWMIDAEMPVLNCPGANSGGVVDLGCNPLTDLDDIPLEVVNTVTMTDNCDPATTAVDFIDTNVSLTGCNQSITRTFNFTDACDNTGTCTVTYNWMVDTEDPMLSCPGENTGGVVDLGCNPPTADGVLVDLAISVVVVDNCDGTTTSTDFTDSNIDLDGCDRMLTRTFTYTDACDNTAECSVTYIWTVDVEMPVLTCPGANSNGMIDLGCNPPGTPGIPTEVVTMVTVSDNCDLGTMTTDFMDSNVDLTGCDQSLTRTFTYTDFCENTGTCSVTYNWVVDGELPTLTCPGNGQPMDLGCNPLVDLSGIPTGITTTVPVLDNCDGMATATIFQDSNVDLDGCDQGLTRTFTYTDACDNVNTCSVIYTWMVDIEDPVLTCPNDGNPIDLGCNPPSTNDIPDEAAGMVNVMDNCDGMTTTSSFTDNLVTDECGRTLTRTFTYTDACGNTGTCDAVYVWVEDMGGVTLECPATAPVDLGCNPPSTNGIPDAIVTSVDVGDNCDQTTTTTDFTDVSDLDGCDQSLTRTFTYVDACDNVGMCDISYFWMVDTEIPTLVCPTGSPIDLGCNPPATNGTPDAIVGSVQVIDNCDPTTSTSDFSDMPSAVGCVQTLTRTFTHTDLCDNTGTCEVTYTWIEDTQEPVLSCPGDGQPIDLGCNPMSTNDLPNDIITSVDVSDNCDNVPNTTDYSDVADLDGCDQSLMRTFTYTDICDNTGTCTVTYTWMVDTEIPTLVCPTGSPIDLGCNPPATNGIPDAIVGSVQIIDNCDPANSTSDFSDVTSAVGCVQTLTRTFTHTDLCNNTGTCEVTYTWIEDTQDPVLSCPGDGQPIDLGCNPMNTGGIPDDIITSVDVSDNCDNVPNTTDFSDVADLVGCDQSIVRTFTYTDICDNTGTCTVTYTWIVDVIEPILDCPGAGNPIDLGCNPPNTNGIPNDIVGSVGVGDNCDAATTTDMFSDVADLVGCDQSLTRTFTYTDFCGNTGMCSIDYFWMVDTEMPVLTCPGDGMPIDLGCNPPMTNGIPDAVVTFVDVTDNCDDATTTSQYTDETSGDGCDMSLTRTFSYTDACGNTGTCSVTYIWQGGVSQPTVDCPTNLPIDLGCNPESTGDLPNDLITSVPVLDACDGTSSTTDFEDDPLIIAGCNRFLVRTFTYTNSCGLDGFCVVSFAWRLDTEEPVLECPGDGQPVDLGCNPSNTNGVPNALDTSVAFTDNCDEDGTTSDFLDMNVDLTGCEQGLTRVFSYTDQCDNIGSCSVVYTWRFDAEPPTIECQDQGQILLSCDENPPAPNPDQLVVNDNCGAGQVMVEHVGDAISGTPNSIVDPLTIVRTYRAVDACGNEAFCTEVYLFLLDTGVPTVTCPPDVTLGCDESLPFPADDFADFINIGGALSDNCSLVSALTVTSEDVENGNTSCPEDGERVVTRIYTITDEAGNSTICEQDFIFPEDPVGPSFPGCITNIPIQCEDDIVFQFPDLVDDGCIAEYEYVGPYVVGTPNCPGTQYIVEYTATDDCGRVASCVQVFTIIDEPLILDCPADLIIECSEENRSQIINDWLNSVNSPATTLCGVGISSVSNTYNPNAFSNDNCSPLAGSQTVVFTVTDACGRIATCSADIHIVDEEAPIITCDAKADVAECLYAEAHFQDWIDDHGHSVAHDVCGVITWTTIPENPTVDITCGDIEVTFIATDGCGNVSTTTGIFTIIDSFAPVITSHASHVVVPCSDANVEQQYQDWLASNGGATAEDECSTISWWSGNPPLEYQCDGSTPPIYVTFTATDDCGNTATTVGSFRVVDEEAPVFTYIPEDVHLSCDDAILFPNVLLEEAEVEDACSEVHLSSVDETIEGCCGSSQIVRTWTAVDDCGNVATASQTIHLEDNEAPELIFNHPDLIGVQHGDEVLVSCSDFEVYALNDVTYIDNCCSDLTTDIVDYTLEVGDCATDGFIEKVICTWTAVDGCGNIGELSITMVVIDDEGPLLAMPMSLSVTCQATPAYEPPMAMDNCSEDISFHFEDNAPAEDCNNGYQILRTWIATDECGNTSTAIQTIDVQPFAGPAFVFIQTSLALECGGLEDMEEPVCVSNCGDYYLTHEDEWLETDCTEETMLIRTWIATDECGRTSTASQTITMDADEEAPQFDNMPGQKLIRCEEEPVFSEPEITDNCSEISVDIYDTTFEDGCNDVYTRTWTAWDACGNTNSFTQTIIREEDNTAPEFFNVPNSGVLACGEEDGLLMPEATDECRVVSLTKEDEIINGNCEDGYTLIRSWTAVDPCGNAHTIQRTFTVEVDNTAPAFTSVPASQSIGCGATPQFGIPKVIDYCSNTNVTITEQTFAGECENGGSSYTRIWTAEDACGNIATASQTIEIEEDTEAPEIETPETLNLDCDDLPLDITPPSVTDNCNEWTLDFVDEVDGEDCLAGYSIIRYWIAVDACGNTSEVSQFIFIGNIGRATGNSTEKGEQPATSTTSRTNEDNTLLQPATMKLFPNPVKEVVNLQFTTFTAGKSNLFIEDLTGKIVKQLEMNMNAGQFSQTLDVSDFASGTYVVVWIFNGQRYYTKLVKS